MHQVPEYIFIYNIFCQHLDKTPTGISNYIGICLNNIKNMNNWNKLHLKRLIPRNCTFFIDFLNMILKFMESLINFANSPGF